MVKEYLETIAEITPQDKEHTQRNIYIDEFYIGFNH